MALDNLLTDGEPDARARVLFVRLQSLEEDEDTLTILRLNADTVIADAPLFTRPGAARH